MPGRFTRLVANAKFAPTFVGLLFNPYFLIRRGLYKGVLRHKAYLHGRVLDFGCGQKPYQDMFDVQEYVGLDIEVSGHSHAQEQIDVFYDGKTVPFGNDHFDSIFSSEVFEHVFNLDDVLDELFRVLKPGGHMVITVPFVWDEHEMPYDFARYTSYGIAHLLKKAGFTIIAVDKSTTYVETLVQMWIAYLYHTVFPRNRAIRTLMTILFIAPMTIVGMAISMVLPKNPGFYHNNIVVAKKA